MCSCVADRELAAVSTAFSFVIFRTKQSKSAAPVSTLQVLEQKCLRINMQKNYESCTCDGTTNDITREHWLKRWQDAYRDREQVRWDKAGPADNDGSAQEITWVLWEQKFHCLVQNTLRIAPLRRQIIPVHDISFCSLIFKHI